jgi:hypothetical protein
VARPELVPMPARPSVRLTHDRTNVHIIGLGKDRNVAHPSGLRGSYSLRLAYFADELTMDLVEGLPRSGWSEIADRLVPASFPAFVPQMLTNWTPLVLLAGHPFQLPQRVTR